MEETVQHLKTAVESGRTDIIRLTIDAHSAQPKIKDVQGHHSSKMDTKLMDALNSVTPDHGNMLHLAAKLGNADVVRALLVSGVDPSIKDSQEQTAYDIAKSSNQLTMVFHDVLLQSIAQSKSEQVKQLLSSGLDINSKDEATGGNTALHWAASFSGLEIIQILLEYKPDVNATNADGTTPLHDAVMRGDVDIVKELVAHGADIHAKATGGKSEGKTPIDLAEDKPEVKDVLVPPVIMNGHVQNGQNGETVQQSDDNDSVEVPFISVTLESEEEKTEEGKESLVKDDSTTTPEAASPQVSSSSNQDEDELMADEAEDVEEEQEEEEEEEDVEEDPRLTFLWPQPQQIIQKNGDRFILSQDFTVQLAAIPQSGTLEPMVDLWTIQSAVLMEKGYRCVLENSVVRLDQSAQVVCTINPLSFSRDEGYRISVSAKMVTIVAADLPGLWHATSTFVQLVQLCHKDGIPQLEISDWPSIKHRAVMLDLSAGRVPRMDTLLQLVNSFAQLKYNELHLYVKAYKDSPIQDTMPYTGSELLDLEVFCQWRFIKLVPHIDLMEDSDLSPALFSIFQQVLSRFGSTRVVNIGPNLTRKLLDSVPPPSASPHPGIPQDTGSRVTTDQSKIPDATPKKDTPGSEAKTEESGETKTEVEGVGEDGIEAPRPSPFILSIQDQLRLIGVGRNQTALFCANVISVYETSFKQLPIGSVAMLYGSKSNSDFRKAGKKLLANGQGFYVCPGTGVWNSLGGAPEGSICNISNAIKAATTNPNALGLLLTNWAGCTYSNHPVLSWPAYISAAGLSWNASTSLDFLHGNLSSLINRHMLQDPDSPLGDAVLEVGRIDTYLTKASLNQLDLPVTDKAVTIPAREGSFLCRLIQETDSVDLEYMTMEVINNAMRRIRKSQTAVNAVDKLKLDRRVYIQIHLTLDLMFWACKMVRALVIAGKKPTSTQSGFNVINVGLANLSATTKTDSANKLLSMMEEYRNVWLDQCFQPGLEASGMFFKAVLKHLVPEGAEKTED